MLREARPGQQHYRAVSIWQSWRASSCTIRPLHRLGCVAMLLAALQPDSRLMALADIGARGALKARIDRLGINRDLAEQVMAAAGNAESAPDQQLVEQRGGLQISCDSRHRD